jgi:putative ABC transport system permease protein
VSGQFKRQIRQSEFRLLFASILLAGIALGAVGIFGDRMEREMVNRTSAMLGADAQISSTRPLDDSYGREAEKFGLEVARSVNFMSMIINDQGSRLAGVRAVSSNYPLRGQIVLKDQDDLTANRKAGSAPPVGSVWAASQLIKDLGLEADSSIQLGDSVFKYQHEILLEPEGGAGMLRLAPRILINLADLDETGLISPASRARFRLMVAGDPDALSRFEAAIKPQLKEHESWRIADTRQQQVRNTVGRIVSFIRLAILLSVILAVVAMALAAQGLWGKQANEIALLRCLGQQHSQTLKRLARSYLGAALPAALIGVMMGFGLQAVAGKLVENATGILLPPATWLPGLIAVIICMASLVAVTLPILISVKQIPTISLLRSGQTDEIRKNRLAIYSILVFLVLLTVFLARDLTLAFSVLAGLVVAAVLLWSCIRILIVLASRYIPPKSSAWYLAVKAICSNGSRSAWIASTFAAIMFSLLLLGLVRGEIFEAWEKSVPDTAPNLFLINIKESNTEPLANMLLNNGVTRADMYAVIRGRIAKINNRDVGNLNFKSEESRHRINHEFNFTELSDLPADNTIISGEWFSQDKPGLSIERETAQVLEVSTGDQLTLDIAGMTFTAPITSIREVKWDNMQPNFYIIASPGVLGDAARNYISGIYVPQQRSELVYEINRQFPNVTAIDLGMLLERFRKLADQGSGAISVVFLFTLASALLVFIGMIQAQKPSRQREIALLKSMGASRKFIKNSIFTEFALTGFIAGSVAGILAMLSSWLLARNLFELSFSIPWVALALYILCGTLIVSVTGFLSIRNLLDELPVRLLSPSSQSRG